MLSYTELAVTTAEADGYLATIGASGWVGTDEVKAQALMRGQRYVASLYNSRWSEDFENDAAPDALKYAIIEAARHELSTPGLLSPVVKAGPQKVMTAAGPIKWEVVDNGSGRLVPLIPAIDGLLTGLVNPARGSTYTASFLRA